MQQSIRNNLGLWSTVLHAVCIFSLLGCRGSDVVNISYDKCWSGIKDNALVQGSAVIYYFPNNRMFITNRVCPKQVIGVSGGVSTFMLPIFDKSLEARKDAFGLSRIVNIRGRIFRNGSNKENLINPETIQLLMEHGPVFVAE